MEILKPKLIAILSIGFKSSLLGNNADIMEYPNRNIINGRAKKFLEVFHLIEVTEWMIWLIKQEHLLFANLMNILTSYKNIYNKII